MITCTLLSKFTENIRVRNFLITNQLDIFDDNTMKKIIINFQFKLSFKGTIFVKKYFYFTFFTVPV